MAQCAGCDSQERGLYQQLDWPLMCEACNGVAMRIMDNMPKLVGNVSDLIAWVRQEVEDRRKRGEWIEG